MEQNNNRSLKYILDILPKAQNELTLFLYFDSTNRMLIATFGSAFNIIRYFWQQHTKYATDLDYPDAISFLMSRIKQTGYRAPQEYMETIVDRPTSIADVNNLAFLFMTNHCAISQDEMFGYTQLPEQKFLVEEFLSRIGYKNELISIANSIINKAVGTEFYVRRMPLPY